MAQKHNRSFKILLIEDDPALCASWQDLFSLIGHEIVCHQRGMNALADKAAIMNADLIISDFYLPDINGVELIRQLRFSRPGLKAILLTGSREASVVDAARALPECSILNKPINIDTIETYLNQLAA